MRSLRSSFLSLRVMYASSRFFFFELILGASGSAFFLLSASSALRFLRCSGSMMAAFESSSGSYARFLLAAAAAAEARRPFSLYRGRGAPTWCTVIARALWVADPPPPSAAHNFCRWADRETVRPTAGVGWRLGLVFSRDRIQSKDASRPPPRHGMESPVASGSTPLSPSRAANTRPLSPDASDSLATSQAPRVRKRLVLEPDEDFMEAALLAEAEMDGLDAEPEQPPTPAPEAEARVMPPDVPLDGGDEDVEMHEEEEQVFVRREGVREGKQRLVLVPDDAFEPDADADAGTSRHSPVRPSC